MKAAKVTGLYIYPVKSCRGFVVNELSLTDTGTDFDRRWMIVDEENKFMTLRTNSKLAEIKTSIQGPFLHIYAGSNKILVNIPAECEQVENVSVWKDSFKAGIENKSINEGLSDFFSKSVKLVRYQSDSFRDLGAGATDFVKETMFADARPLLLLNEASLKDLNDKLNDQGKAPSQIERFRGNIIVEGFSAFEEEKFKEFKIHSSDGEITLMNSKLCGRCPVVTQDVETGKVVSKETLQLLANYRKQQDSNKIPFGVYLTPGSAGKIRVGDRISGQI